MKHRHSEADLNAIVLSAKARRAQEVYRLAGLLFRRRAEKAPSNAVSG